MSEMITIQELLQRIDNATDGMGQRNPYRVLLRQCRVAIAYLAERIPDEALLTQKEVAAP